MALPAEQLQPAEDFIAAVARNIRTVLAMRERTAQDVAVEAGLTPSKFSQRMSGPTRWLAVELLHVARVLDVSVDVLTAQTEEELRSALSREMRCITILPAPEGQLSFDEYVPGPPALALVDA